MGMFDYVFTTCPSCGAKIEFQSKAGQCALNSYSTDSLPVEIAADLLDEISACSCGAEVQLVRPPLTRFMPLFVQLVKDGKKP